MSKSNEHGAGANVRAEAGEDTLLALRDGATGRAQKVLDDVLYSRTKGAEQAAGAWLAIAEQRLKTALEEATRAADRGVTNAGEEKTELARALGLVKAALPAQEQAAA